MTQRQFILFMIGASLLLSSCKPLPPAKPPITTQSQAEKKFLDICHTELKISPIVHSLGKTVWIYIPLKDSVFEIKAQNNNAPSAPVTNSWSIQFLESNFNSRQFQVRYDIAMTKKYDKSVSYQNKFSDEYSSTQRDVIGAITRAYFDVGTTQITVPLIVGSSEKPSLAVEMAKPPAHIKEEPPDFFVMVFIDLKRGVGIKSINYFPDMKMMMSIPPALTSEEYALRFVYDVFGDERLIGDRLGINLDIKEVTMGEFLAKQIENRINNKFVRSAFPPTGEARDNIFNIIAETCRIYNFKDFDKVKITDLNAGQEYLYDKGQL